MRLAPLAIGLAALVPIAATAQPKLPNGKPFQAIGDEFAIVDDRLTGVEDAVQDLDETLKQLLQCVTVIQGYLGGLPGPHVVFSRCNVHVRSGATATDAAVNGSGNLIVGYNEGRCTGDPDGGGGITDNPDSFFQKACLVDSECGDGGICDFGNREGSHNVIVGHQHEYGSFGGVVGGRANALAAEHTSVAAGHRDLADAPFSSIQGGIDNRASGEAATVVGGFDNDAQGVSSAVVAGTGNTATGPESAVVAGNSNLAVGPQSAAIAGRGNEAIGIRAATVGGGGLILGDPVGTIGGNRAFGDYSAILGGQFNLAGSLPRDNPNWDFTDGYAAAVCGGSINNAAGITATIGGGTSNLAAGDFSTVSGGVSNQALGENSAVGGGRDQDANSADEFKP